MDAVRVRHKDANTFKFVSFSERISNINIDVFHRVPHRFEEESTENDTFFYLAVKKWSVLNLTQKWINFKRKIGRDVQTLPQLLNDRERIFDVFLNDIKLQDALSLQPVLELIVALVKDLRHEFYPFYPQILKELIPLLNFNDPDVVEATFTCLAHLFKYLQKEMVKELDKVLLGLAPLLNDKNPEYVREFAAQGFAFVARKVKDRNNLLCLVLFVVQSSPELADGCAHLVFEMMRGINGQSHSCTKEVFSALFDLFGNRKIPQKTLYEFTTKVVEVYVLTIRPGYSVLFKVLIEGLTNRLQTSNLEGLTQLLNILKGGLGLMEGAHLSETDLPVLVNLLVTLLSMEKEVQDIAASISSLMLTSKKLKIPQELGSTIITQVFEVEEVQTLLKFIEETSVCASFEASILPRAIEHFSSLNCFEFLGVMAKIASQKVTTEKFVVKNYPLKITETASQLKDFVKDILEDFQNHDIEHVLCCIILLRHMEPFGYVEVSSLLKNILQSATLGVTRRVEKKFENLFIICTVLETIVSKTDYCCSGAVSCPNLWSVLLRSLKNDKSILALRALDILVTVCEGHIGDCSTHELTVAIREWLLCPQSNARRLALHCIQKMEQTIPGRAPMEMVEVLQCAIDAEFIPLSITYYREKIRLLEKLNFGGIGLLTPDHRVVLLKYLLGSLYCNFNLLWDPISQIIAGYSLGMPQSSFWNVFHPQLSRATAYCLGQPRLYNFDVPVFDQFLLDNVRFIKAEDKVHHSHYRILLWTAMNLFSDLCENSNRDVVPLYLRFQSDAWGTEEKPQVNLQEEDPSAENEPQNVDGSSQAENRSRENLVYLIAQLRLFSKFKNPGKFYRSSEVESSFFDLLMHRNPEVQKLALECLFTFGQESIMPYKQNLRNLMDDKKFKDELVNFKFGTTCGIVRANHRDDVMRIVMRILCRRLWSRAPTPRGNKGSANQCNRSNILRFIADCADDEKCLFLQTSFKANDREWHGGDLDVVVEKASVDLGNFPRPKKIQGSLNFAGTVLDILGGSLSSTLKRKVLRFLLCTGCKITAALGERSNISPGYRTSLKNSRTRCIDCIIMFFERFDGFFWHDCDINSIFEVFVWPVLARLPLEAVHSPTALLRLFHTWSKEARFFPHLVRHDRRNRELTPLPYIMKLLLNPQSQPPVITCISSMLENLVTLKLNSVDDVKGRFPLPSVKGVLPLWEVDIENLRLEEPLNYGTKILYPHVADILAFLLRRLQGASGLEKPHLTVLSRISEMASSQEHADSLMTLIIRVLSAPRRHDNDAVEKMVKTLDNLTNIVSDPKSYLRSMAALFSTVESMEGRKSLLSAVSNLNRSCAQLKKVMSIVSDLNALTWGSMGRTDLSKGLDDFKTIRDMVEADGFDTDLAFIILHNCAFFVRCSVDLSMVDSAMFCLTEICPKVGNSLKKWNRIRKEWIDSVLLLARRGIVSDNEHYQALAISLLGAMARECGDLHPVFKDLSLLANKQDPEVDFFENCQHLQIYRRMKALQKFSNVAKTLREPPTPRTLTQFILPIAGKYLCSQKYAGKNSLVDSAIEVVATACKFLPWREYNSTLQLYSRKLSTNLEFQKQMMRTVTAILDAFHFNISQSPGVPQKEVSVEVEKDSDLVRTTESENEEVNEESDGNRAEKESEREVLVETGEVEVQAEEGTPIESEAQSSEPPEPTENTVTVMDETQHGEEGQKEDMDVIFIEEKPRDLGAVEEENEVEIIPNEPSGEAASVAEGAENAAETAGPEVVSENACEENVHAIDSVTVLSAEAARNVEKAISGRLLKELYKVLERKSEVEGTHRLNQRNVASKKDEEDCLKIPLALAVVRLLQKLPERMLETQLPGVITMCCTYLRSRTESVRRVTRETLQQIAAALGPKYLALIFSEMSTLLTRGFQAHVLVFTMHAILVHVQGLLRPGDIDANLVVLLEACKSDLFGALSEEKDVAQVRAKHTETKKTKSYHLVQIVARHITEGCLTNVIVPVKEVLQATYSHKNIARCRAYLKNVVAGVSANRFLSNESLLIYVYGTTSEVIPELRPTPPEPQERKNPKEKEDCFIIPPDPKTTTAISAGSKRNSKISSHVFVEYGLSLLLKLLKNAGAMSSHSDIRTYLDPMVPILIQIIESNHVEASVLGIQCLTKFVKYDVPSLRVEVKKITSSLFKILHKFGTKSLSKGANFELVVAAFKAITTLIRETHSHGLSADQLKTLLLYTEQDIHDSSRQATAFSLLKTILRKKLDCPELCDLMVKVANLSVTSELPHIRVQARQSVLQYVMDYPLKEKLTTFVDFYISQLQFDVESGRQSSLEMLESFVASFPVKTLEGYAEGLVLLVSVQLLNDDSATCRKMTSDLLKLLFSRVSPEVRDRLFHLILTGMGSEPISHRKLAAQLMGLMVTVEEDQFRRRLSAVLPLMQQQLVGHPRAGRSVALPRNAPEEERERDQLIFQVLLLLQNICSHCSFFLTSKEFQENIQLFTEISQRLLSHPHEWTRLAAASYLTSVFNSCQPSDVAAVLNGRPLNSHLSFLEPTTIRNRLKTLVLDHIAQLVPGVTLNEEFLQKVFENLLFFAAVFREVSVDETEQGEADGEKKEKNEELTFLWLVRLMRRVVLRELVRFPSSTVLRTSVFRWTGTVAGSSSKAQLKKVLYHLMAPVVRERDVLESDNREGPFKTLVTDVCGILKKKVGQDAYAREVAKIKHKIMEKRVQRKSEKAEEFVTDPEAAAKKKMQKQQKKKTAKKRKLEKLKERKGFLSKKRRKNDD